jgi:hypothetical protein
MNKRKYQRTNRNWNEPRHLLVGNEVAFEELAQQRAHAPVHDELRTNQQRHRREEADVHFHVPQKRHARIAADEMSFQGGQQQQRQPGQQRDDDDAPAHHRQRIVRQMRPPQ